MTSHDALDDYFYTDSDKDVMINKNGIKVFPPTTKRLEKLSKVRERERQFIQSNYIIRRLKRKLSIVPICAYCGTKENLTIDHRIPIVLGGPDCKENLIKACEACNKSKGGNLLESDIPLFRFFLKREMIVESKVPIWLWRMING